MDKGGGIGVSYSQGVEVPGYTRPSVGPGPSKTNQLCYSITVWINKGDGVGASYSQDPVIPGLTGASMGLGPTNENQLFSSMTL